MENSAISVCLFLLLRLSASPVTGNQSGVTSPHQPYDVNPTEAHEENSTVETHPAIGTADQAADPFFPVPDNGTRADCLIDTEMGLIAVASAGALILCLLVTTLALGVQVCYLQRRACGAGPRRSRSNADLQASAATGRYWGVAADRSEAEGLVGPCDASVMLEEVRADREAGKRGEEVDERPEAEVGLLEGLREVTDGQEEVLPPPRAPLRSSSSRDSCTDNPRDLEDMPLVV